MGINSEWGGIKDGAAKVWQGARTATNPDYIKASWEANKAERAAAGEARKAAGEAAASARKAASDEAIAGIKANAGKTAERVAATESRGFIAGGINLVFKPIKAGMKLGVKILEVPVALGMKPIKAGTQALGDAFVRSPGKALGGTLAGTAIVGGVLVANSIGRRNSKKMEAQHAALGEYVEAKAAQQAAVPAVSYMNSASQADVDARIAQDIASGKAPAGQAQALAARQAISAPESLAV